MENKSPATNVVAKRALEGKTLEGRKKFIGEWLANHRQVHGHRVPANKSTFKCAGLRLANAAADAAGYPRPGYTLSETSAKKPKTTARPNNIIDAREKFFKRQCRIIAEKVQAKMRDRKAINEGLEECAREAIDRATRIAWNDFALNIQQVRAIVGLPMF